MTNKTPLPKLTTTVEMVTPQMASQWLGTIDIQRRLRRRKIEQYARQMMTGKWHLNGEALIFSNDGKLKNGQHRLHAVLLAKVTVAMLVVRGILPEAMATIDTGASRNYRDVLQLRDGEGHGGEIAAIARWFWLYETTDAMIARTSLAHQEIDEVVAQHSSIRHAVDRVSRSPFRKHAPRAVIGFVYAFICEKWDEDTAELFLMEVERGVNLTERSPVYLLRRRLIDYDGPRLDAIHALALFIKAFNYWQVGEQLQVLSWKRGSEGFPRFGKPSKDAMRNRARNDRGGAQ